MSEEELKALEGLNVEEAKKQIEGKRFQFHVLSRDGFAMPVVKNFQRNRIGVNVTKGKVTSAVIG
ncbi:MAG: hypothetical protein HY040_15050 [Planctomycetes bacterium]|nr:hypothetical protein [Planctomycetota bacterium]